METCCLPKSTSHHLTWTLQDFTGFMTAGGQESTHPSQPTNSPNLKPRTVEKKTVPTVAGVVLGVEPLPAGLQTLALVQEEPTRTQ